MRTRLAIPISSDITIDTTSRQGNLYVEVRGELDVGTTPLLDAKLAEAEATDAPLIVVDITGVPFIDSTGLRALLQAHSRSTPGNRLRITEGAPQAQRLFELAGVLDTLPFVSPAELGRIRDAEA